MFGLELIESILSIVIIDLVLSGDNAIVIAMATRSLPAAERRRAIMLGATGAIALRVLCTALVAVLLGIPLLQAAGGLLLIWIAYKLLRQHKAHTAREGSTLGEAVRTIVLADAIMSLDNMLAVGGVAHGNFRLLLFGLALSMPIIVFASGLIVTILNRLPWLLYVGAAILTYTAVKMLLEDPLVRPLYPHVDAFAWISTLLALGGVLGLAHMRNRRDQASLSPQPVKRETTNPLGTEQEGTAYMPYPAHGQRDTA